MKIKKSMKRSIGLTLLVCLCCLTVNLPVFAALTDVVNINFDSYNTGTVNAGTTGWGSIITDDWYIINKDTSVTGATAKGADGALNVTVNKSSAATDLSLRKASAAFRPAFPHTDAVNDPIVLKTTIKHDGAQDLTFKIYAQEKSHGTKMSRDYLVLTADGKIKVLGQDTGLTYKPSAWMDIELGVIDKGNAKDNGKKNSITYCIRIIQDGAAQTKKGNIELYTEATATDLSGTGNEWNETNYPLGMGSYSIDHICLNVPAHSSDTPVTYSIDQFSFSKATETDVTEIAEKIVITPTGNAWNFDADTNATESPNTTLLEYGKSSSWELANEATGKSLFIKGDSTSGSEFGLKYLTLGYGKDGDKYIVGPSVFDISLKIPTSAGAEFGDNDRYFYGLVHEGEVFSVYGDGWMTFMSKDVNEKCFKFEKDTWYKLRLYTDAKKIASIMIYDAQGNPLFTRTSTSAWIGKGNWLERLVISKNAYLYVDNVGLYTAPVSANTGSPETISPKYSVPNHGTASASEAVTITFTKPVDASYVGNEKVYVTRDGEYIENYTKTWNADKTELTVGGLNVNGKYNVTVKAVPASGNVTEKVNTYVEFDKVSAGNISLTKNGITGNLSAGFGSESYGNGKNVMFIIAGYTGNVLKEVTLEYVVLDGNKRDYSTALSSSYEDVRVFVWEKDSLKPIK